MLLHPAVAVSLAPLASFCFFFHLGNRTSFCSNDDAARELRKEIHVGTKGERSWNAGLLPRKKSYAELLSGFVVQRSVCCLVLSLLHTLIREFELASWACY